jgi:hypothetical protein
MTDTSISAVSSSNLNLEQNSLSNNNQITSMLLNGNIDPKFARMLLSQMYNNNVNTILFGSEDTTGSSSSGSIDIFDTQSTASSSNFNSLGEAANFTSVSPQYQMSVYSSLIGKTVTATKPLTNEQITGKVTSVQLQNGQVVLNVEGTLVPTGNLLKIQ